jgi:hypothetical protein
MGDAEPTEEGSAYGSALMEEKRSGVEIDDHGKPQHAGVFCSYRSSCLLVALLEAFSCQSISQDVPSIQLPSIQLSAGRVVGTH